MKPKCGRCCRALNCGLTNWATGALSPRATCRDGRRGRWNGWTAPAWFANPRCYAVDCMFAQSLLKDSTGPVNPTDGRSTPAGGAVTTETGIRASGRVDPAGTAPNFAL